MLKPKGKKQEKRRLPWSPIVKHFSKRKDRARTRELLHHEKYDDIPSKQRTNEEDPWGWA